MNVPPLILDLRVAPSDRRPVHLWLPLFLLWPLALVVGVLALAVALVADGVLFALRRRYHHNTVLLVRSCALLGETRGTVICFSNANTAVDLTVK
jgi:hypothetical protein